jgi:hypothetical protein
MILYAKPDYRKISRKDIKLFFSCAFASSRKAPIIFMSVLQSAAYINLAASWQILVKLEIGGGGGGRERILKYVEKLQRCFEI